MSKRCKLIICFSVILSVFAVLVCINVFSIENRALKYLNEKYQDDFTLVCDKNDRGEITYCPGIVYGGVEPVNQFYVIQNEDGTFSDNYYGVYIHDDFYELIDNKVSKYFDSYGICFDFNNDFYDTVWDKNTPLEWALADNPSYFDVTIGIFTSDDLSNKNLQDFYDEFSEDYWYGKIYVYTMASGNIASMNDSNFRNYISKSYYTNNYKGSYEFNEIKETDDNE